MAKKTTLLVSSSLKVMAIISLAASLVWTMYTLYSVMKSPVDLEVPAEVLKPVDPKIDQATLEEIAARRQLTDDPTVDQTLIKVVSGLASPSPTSSSTKTSSTNTTTTTPEIDVITTNTASSSASDTDVTSSSVNSQL